MGDVTANSDNHPVCYQFTIGIWLSKYFPSLAGVDFLEKVSENDLIKYLSPILILILFITIRRRLKFKRVLITAVAGFLGMLFEMVLILNYQAKAGALYQNLGILLMSFMAGLFIGAMWIDMVYKKQNLKTAKRTILFIVFIFILANGFFLLLMDNSLISSLFVTIILLVVSGCYVAGIFSFSSIYKTRDLKLLISPLLFADLIGGCLASVLGTLIFIPMFGISASLLLILFIAFFSIILL